MNIYHYSWPLNNKGWSQQVHLYVDFFFFSEYILEYYIVHGWLYSQVQNPEGWLVSCTGVFDFEEGQGP